ncbi:MAG: hypothetical protein KF716_23720 [Anaerolineae bacterium]|nr:hypothetical protein [Anaerolineae bacterium]
MRKLYALFVLIVVFFPLAIATMTMTAIRPWLLDRGFYERIVNNDHFYEAMWTEDLSNRFDEALFTNVEQLPLGALSLALREVVMPAYLRGQTLNVIDQVFNTIEGRAKDFTLTLDIAPLKTILIGEGRLPFAAALAAALPPCAVDQAPIAPNGNLVRCIAADSSVEAAAAQIADALPTVLKTTPDQLVIEGQGYVRTNWYDFAWFLGSGIHNVLDLAILMMGFVTVSIGFVAVYFGGDDQRGRLKWFGAALLVPASLFLLSGIGLTARWGIDAVTASIATTRWDGVQYSQSFREAVASVVVPIVQQIGSGFLLTGAVACLMALGLLVLSWITPAEGQPSPKVVQVRVRTS